jgi:hypothetical protein
MRQRKVDETHGRWGVNKSSGVEINNEPASGDIVRSEVAEANVV